MGSSLDQTEQITTTNANINSSQLSSGASSPSAAEQSAINTPSPHYASSLAVANFRGGSESIDSNSSLTGGESSSGEQSGDSCAAPSAAEAGNDDDVDHNVSTATTTAEEQQTSSTTEASPAAAAAGGDNSAEGIASNSAATEETSSGEVPVEAAAEAAEEQQLVVEDSSAPDMATRRHSEVREICFTVCAAAVRKVVIRVKCYCCCCCFMNVCERECDFVIFESVCYLWCVLSLLSMNSLSLTHLRWKV